METGPDQGSGTPSRSIVLHASAVAWKQRAVLFVGPSGSGKSALCLQLMAFGAVLIADDRTILHRDGEKLILTSPAGLRGMIEARGVGLLAANTVEAAQLTLAVDLSQEETERLPPERSVSWLGVSIPLLHKTAHAHFPASILQYLKSGRRA